MIKTETIPVYGMMCGHCVKAVKMALEDIDGVTGTEVILEENAAIVTFDDALTGTESFTEAIIEEGYTLEPEEEDSEPETDTGTPVTVSSNAIASQFFITGMSCVNCAGSIEKGFKNSEGIYSATVNFAIERLTVEHSPDLSAADIIKKFQIWGIRLQKKEKSIRTCYCKKENSDFFRSPVNNPAGDLHVYHAVWPCGDKLCHVCSCYTGSVCFRTNFL